MSGALAVDELAILRRQIGDAAYERTMASLSGSIRTDLQALTAIGWIDVELIKAVFVAAAQVTGQAAEVVHRNAVKAGVEQTFRSVWRLLLRVTTDNALVTRTPMFYAKTYDTGSLTARIVSPGRAELVLSGWPDAEEFCMRGLAIGIETTLTLAGRQGVRVSFDRTTDGARFAAVWRA
jgi:hypothetical protein